jgi:hypothetical protein
MYKKWLEICAIPDKHFMTAIALLDLTSDFGEIVVASLPQFFTEKKQAGPIPLSIIIKNAFSSPLAIGREYGPPEWHLEEYGAIPDDWPIIYFGDEESCSENDSLQLIPKHLMSLQETTDIGKIVEWDGKKIILVDGCVDLGEWTFVPAELICVDL